MYDISNLLYRLEKITSSLESVAAGKIPELRDDDLQDWVLEKLLRERRQCIDVIIQNYHDEQYELPLENTIGCEI